MNITPAVAEIGTDPDALEAFYRQHLESIQRFVARRVTSPHDAADLTADVFLQAIKSCGRYKAQAGTPSAWLHGIARNVVAGHYRVSARAARTTTRFSARDWLDEDSTERLAERIDAERDSRLLLEQLAALPESQRALVELVAVDELALVEAAHALGISPTNARVRYHRARKRLTIALPSIFEVTS